MKYRFLLHAVAISCMMMATLAGNAQQPCNNGSFEDGLQPNWLYFLYDNV